MSRNNKKRIILSDEEDDNVDDEVVVLPETASAQKLADSIHQLKVTDSATKAPRFHSIKKKLFDEENGIEESGNRVSGVSSRSQALSSKKESQRAKAAAEIQRFKSKGLSAFSVDDSEDEYYDEDEEDEDNMDDDDDDEDDIHMSSKRKPPQRREVDSRISAPKKPSRPSNSSSRPSSAIAKRAGPSADAMRAFSEYRGNQERDDEQYASDLDDFIVADEEEQEEDEEDHNEESAEEDDESSDGDAELDGPTTNVSGLRTKSPPSKPSKSKSSSHRKSIIVNSDQEDLGKADNTDGEEEDDNKPHVSKSTQKRRVRRALFSGSDDEEEEAEDEDNDEEADDGPLLYWKLNAQMDEAADEGDDYADAKQMFSMNQTYTLEQAFAIYVEMLGKALVSARFRKQLQTRTLSRQKLATYDKAARQIENLICTHRESLLGSSAWQGDFLQELQNRPFYMCPQSSSSGNNGGCCGDGEGRCAACGRTAKEAFFSVFLYGPRYDGMTIWSQNKWIQSLPTCMFLNPDDEDEEEDCDGSEDDQDRSRRSSSSKNKVSGKKRGRNSQYVSYEDAMIAAEQGKSVGVTGEDSEEENDDEDEEENEAYRQNRHKRNKQFSAFQQHKTPVILPLSSALKTPSTTSSSFSSTVNSKKRSRAESEEISSEQKNSASNQQQHMDQDDEDGNIVRHTSNKKRRVVILSDSEHEEDSQHYAKKQQRQPQSDDDDHMDDDTAEDVSSNNRKKLAVSSPSKWWNKALPRALNQENESRWELSVHCKNRTNLYHTLLHYKFRLILKLRENLEKVLHRRQDKGCAEYALEDLPASYRRELLEELLGESHRGRSFVAQETDRFQVLLRTAEKRYGGDKFEVSADIWGNETLPVNSKSSSSSSSSSASVSNSNKNSSSSSSSSSSNMRQLKLLKKDFRAFGGNGSASIMGDPRRSTIQSRISSWLTPKN